MNAVESVGTVTALTLLLVVWYLPYRRRKRRDSAEQCADLVYWRALRRNLDLDSRTKTAMPLNRPAAVDPPCGLVPGTAVKTSAGPRQLSNEGHG